MLEKEKKVIWDSAEMLKNVFAEVEMIDKDLQYIKKHEKRLIDSIPEDMRPKIKGYLECVTSVQILDYTNDLLSTIMDKLELTISALEIFDE